MGCQRENRYSNGNMTHTDQNQPEVSETMTSLVGPKLITKIGY